VSMGGMTTPRVPRVPLGPPTSLLRVYEPLVAFGDQEGALAERARRPPTRDEADREERAASWHRVVRGHAATMDEVDVVRFRVVEGTVVACPAQVRLRCAAAMREAGRMLPAPIVAAALGGHHRPDPKPPTTSRPSETEPGTLHVRRRPRQYEVDAEHASASVTDQRLRTLVAGWEIPWAWLALVTETDKGPGDEPVYLVPMAKARTRAARALRAMRQVGGDVELLDEVEEVGRWLEDFPPRSWVELDLRDIARVLAADAADAADAAGAAGAGGASSTDASGAGRASANRRALDLGVEDVALGLESIAAGDATAVAAAYRRLVARRRRLLVLARAS